MSANGTCNAILWAHQNDPPGRAVCLRRHNIGHELYGSSDARAAATNSAREQVHHPDDRGRQGLRRHHQRRRSLRAPELNGGEGSPASQGRTPPVRLVPNHEFLQAKPRAKVHLRTPPGDICRASSARRAARSTPEPGPGSAAFPTMRAGSFCAEGRSSRAGATGRCRQDHGEPGDTAGGRRTRVLRGGPRPGRDRLAARLSCTCCTPSRCSVLPRQVTPGAVWRRSREPRGTAVRGDGHSVGRSPSAARISPCAATSRTGPPAASRCTTRPWTASPGSARRTESTRGRGHGKCARPPRAECPGRIPFEETA